MVDRHFRLQELMPASRDTSPDHKRHQWRTPHRDPIAISHRTVTLQQSGQCCPDRCSMSSSDLELLSVRTDRIFLDLHDRSSRDKQWLMSCTKQPNSTHIYTHLIDRYRDRVVVVGVTDLQWAIGDLIVRKLSTRLDAKLLSRTLSPRHIRDEMDDTCPDKPNCDSDQDPSPEEVARDDCFKHKSTERQKILLLIEWQSMFVVFWKKYFDGSTFISWSGNSLFFFFNLNFYRKYIEIRIFIKFAILLHYMIIDICFK